MKVRIIRPLTSAPRMVLLAGLVAACSSPVETNEPLFWEGTFEQPLDATVLLSGQASMVANPFDTHVGVVVDADAELQLSWLVRNGACSGSGERIAPQTTFPPLTESSASRLSATAVINRRISGSSYAVEIFVGPDGTGELVACADLVRRSSPI
jgi:hypothetical protein